MGDVTVTAGRRMDVSAADALLGQRIPDLPDAVMLPSPDDGSVTQVVDGDTGDVMALVTRLTPLQVQQLRAAVTSMRVEPGGVARNKSKAWAANGGARTFGWSPKRAQAGRESCRATSAAREAPDAHRVLTSLAGHLGDQFRELMPNRAVADEMLLRDRIQSDWLMDEHALWTSGVVNRTSTLPYHRDGSNFRTWSAMPTLRYRTRGGHLHLPEYGLMFPCRDGEVAWFCGRDLVHGVTPMRETGAGAYRYSVVYYALAGMVDCRTFAEEQALAAVRRTEREQRLADKAAGR